MLKALALPNFFSFYSSAPTSRSAGRRVSAAPAKPWQKAAAFGLILMNALVLMSFLAGFNSYATKGYEIKQLQTRSAVLLEENKKLSIKVSEMSSVLNIQDDFANLGYVTAGTPHFLTMPQASQFTLR